MRFNLRRGGSASVEHLEPLARRVHEVAGRHSELYLDSRDLPDIAPVLGGLPAVSIDHLGLSRDGLPSLLELAGQGVRVKATGPSRGDLDVPTTLRRLCQVNPDSMMGGTDLPSTRTTPFEDRDLDLVRDSIDPSLRTAVFHATTQVPYRKPSPADPGARANAAFTVRVRCAP